MTDDYKALESQIREIYGRVVYTHKTHEKCADLFKSRSDTLKGVEISSNSINNNNHFGRTIWEWKNIGSYCCGICSTILLLLLTLYAKDYNSAWNR